MQCNLVLYHAGCYDGFASAWLAHKKFPNAEYVPVQYGQEPPDVTGKDVMILDFSFKRPVMLAMKDVAKSLLCLDHHKTAEAELRGLEWCVFDMEKSGARLTWQYLFCKTINEDDRADQFQEINFKTPWLVDYTEDRDLWRHKLPLTKEINAALRTIQMDFTAWDLMEANPDCKTILASEGVGILRYQKKLIKSHQSHAIETVIDGHKILTVNCTCADLTSEVAGALAKDRPFGMCWFEGEDNERVYSLRSRDGGVDVSEIAKKHGGGGHKNAAGFRVPATGATGVFSEGQINEEDEGDLKIAIAADKPNGVVRIDFGKKIFWLALPKDQAISLGDMLQSKARYL